GGVAGCHRRAGVVSEPGGGGVAGVARPGLEVPGALGAPRALDLEPDLERLAERDAVALVLVGVVAQSVVDMEGGDRPGPKQTNRDVEQADRVAPAGEHRD